MILDELVVTVRVPAGLPGRDARAVCRALRRARTKRRVRDALLAELRPLHRTRIRITIAP